MRPILAPKERETRLQRLLMDPILPLKTRSLLFERVISPLLRHGCLQIRMSSGARAERNNGKNYKPRERGRVFAEAGRVRALFPASAVSAPAASARISAQPAATSATALRCTGLRPAHSLDPRENRGCRRSPREKRFPPPGSVWEEQRRCYWLCERRCR